LIFLVGGTFLLQVTKIPAGPLGYGWARLDPAGIPLDLVEDLKAYEQSCPEGSPIFNDANFGGFLIYHTPSLKIHIDDRCELYKDPGLEAYMKLMYEQPELIEEMQQKHGFRRALVALDSDNRSSPMQLYLARSPKWREVTRGEIAAIYEYVGE
jgi:hypothetical protein